MNSRWRSGKSVAIWMILLGWSIQAPVAHAESGVPISGVYDVAVTEGDSTRDLMVFQSSCPKYQAGYENMKPVDRYPLERFEGRSISWTSFSFSNKVTIHVHVLDAKKVPLIGHVRIFP